VPLKILENQQQNNGYDCGLFAIANLVEFCFNDATYNYKNEFVLNKMRKHLIHCLERGEFSKFPQETI
jgi:Ulp1 family protease